MSKTADQWKAQLSQLSAQERAELAHFLIHSLEEEEEEDADAQETWDNELKRRMAEIHSGKADGVPAESIFAELRKKHS